MNELDRSMLDAFRDELGERKWDDDKGTYTRELHTEEKRLVADMERVYKRCNETLQKVVSSYLAHLEDTSDKPLTFHTPDEDAKLETVMNTKEEYKVVRTLYSDAMIDLDAEYGTGGNPSSTAQQKVDDAKRNYDEMSERLCEDALRYERIYRDELSQRVSGHFTAEQQLLRGVSSAMKDFTPYTRGLTLDWEQMRSTRRSNLAAAKRGDYDDDVALADRLEESLPGAGGFSDESNKRDGVRGDANPFENIASDISHTASGAANAIANAGRTTSKNIAGLVASYAAKGSTSK